MIRDVWSDSERRWLRYDTDCRRACCLAEQRLAAIGNETRSPTVERPRPAAPKGAGGSVKGLAEPPNHRHDLATRLRAAAAAGEHVSPTRVAVLASLLIEAAEELDR